MSPWLPKMATGQDFEKKAVDKFFGAGGEREPFAHPNPNPHLKGWEGHSSLLHPLKTPPATIPEALALELHLLDLWLLAVPPAPCLTYRSLLDLKIHNGKTSKTLIYPRKEPSTSVSDESDLNLTPLNLSSRKKETDDSNKKVSLKNMTFKRKALKLRAHCSLSQREIPRKLRCYKKFCFIWWNGVL